MEYNKLRLKQEEIDFIKKRYQDVDYDNLMYLVEGMSTIRNIDMLISSLDYDIEHKDFSEFGENNDKEALVLLCKDIKDKAVYYRDHNGKNYVKGFNADLFCQKADEIANAAIGEPIGKDIYKIDQSINYVRSIRERLDRQKLWNLSVYMGTKFGELMLDEGLLDLGFDWDMVDAKKYPIIIEPLKKRNIDPIRFIFDKVSLDQSTPDSIGTCSDFYYRFMDSLKG
ncbi:MAG: hypothetical protein II638_06765 [Erysipelotrichaceae bacterium]|nr:hypothetical protein [Erysipelotrichaceae bacterium]